MYNQEQIKLLYGAIHCQAIFVGQFVLNNWQSRCFYMLRFFLNFVNFYNVFGELNIILIYRNQICRYFRNGLDMNVYLVIVIF